MRFILLRGLGRDQKHWKPLLAQLNKDFPEAIIETPDLPGTGVLHHLTSPLKIKDYIPHLKKQLQQPLKKSANENILVGLSFGGMIALKWAETEPENFQNLVLINSSCRLNSIFQRLKILEVLKHFSLGCLFNLRKKESAAYHLTCNKRPMPETLLDDWVKIQKKHPVKNSNQLRQLFAASQLNPPKPDLIPNLHVLYSLADRMVSSKCSENLINYYNATFDQHTEAGHDLSQDDPEWISQKLFLLLKNK